MFIDAGKETIIDNPTGRWVIFAGSLRLCGGFCVGLYKPLFFTKVYPEFVDEFSIYNAVIYGILATFSALMGGVLSDKFEKNSYMTKAYICMGSCLISCPAMTTLLLT